MIRASLSVRWITALALAVLAGLAVVAGSGGATAQDGGASSVDGRIVVRPWVDDAGELSRVEFGFRPGWGLDVRGGADGPDDISPRLRFLTRRLIDERAGTWLRSSEMLIPDAEGSETGVRGRILVRAEADEEGQLTRIEFGFRPDWGADIRGTESGPDDIFPSNRFLTRRLIDGSAEKWLRSSQITVPAERPVELPVEMAGPSEREAGEVGEAGGTATAEDGATITVPASAAAMGAEITARVATEEELPPLPGGATEVLGAWDFEVEGGLTGAVTLTLPVSADEDETWFLAHYDGERWFLEPFTVVDGAIIVQTDSLSFWKKVKGIPIVGTIAKGVEAGGKYFVEGVKKIAEVTWDAVTWTVDWGLEELGLKEPIVCDQPDGSVQVTNPTGGGLVGIYLKGCAQQTADGPLLAARNPRHIWFEVRPIEGEPEYATSLDIYKFLSSHDEGTLLAPSAVGDWRPTRDGTVRLNAEMTWTAAGLTVFYQPIKEMVEAAVGFALPSSALTSLVQKLLSASELRVAVQEFQRGNREAALKTAAVVILSEPMRNLVIDVVISYARSRGVTLAKAPLIKAYVVYKVGEFLVKRAQAGVEFFKVLVANDEDRLGTVAYRVPRSVCWGSAFGADGGNVGDRLGHACQSLQRPERYARYYRFELERPATVTIDLTSTSLDGYLYLLSGEGRSGRVVASDDNGGDGRNARIERELEAGVYTIEATTGGSPRRRTGAFELKVATIADSAGRFVAVSASGWHSCGLRETGAVECWGHNYSNGETDVPSSRFTAVSAGADGTCGLRETGEIECWGWFSERYDTPDGRFTSVSMGLGHACGLRDTGEIVCWGSYWACGLGTDGHCAHSFDRSQAADTRTGSFSAVSAGGYHTCGLRTTGEIECWGARADGFFDDYDLGERDAPGGRFSAVSAGVQYTCGLRETGAVECWGDNWAGETDAPGGRFSAVSAGSSHSCGLRETGAIECWGYNYFGQTDAPDGRFSAVSVGGEHSCGLRETGEVECWGVNQFGQTDAPGGATIVAPQIRPPQIDGINCSPSSPRVNDDVTCTASLSGDAPALYSWRGGPSSSSSSRYTTSWSSAGTYTVNLTVSNDGGSDSDSTSVTVRLPDLDRPDISISCPEYAETGRSISCTVRNRGGAVATWEWSASGGAAGGRSETYSVTFSSFGRHTVRLTASNAGGSDSDSTSVTVRPPDLDRPDISISCPEYAETGRNISCTVRNRGGAVATWEWSASGGAVDGSSETYSLWFSSFGRHIVRLTASNAGGRDMASTTVRLVATPPHSQYSRCGSDTIKVYWFDRVNYRKHHVNMTGEEVTRILGAAWWATIGHLSQSACDSWPTGSPVTAENYR